MSPNPQFGIRNRKNERDVEHRLSDADLASGFLTLRSGYINPTVSSTFRESAPTSKSSAYSEGSHTSPKPFTDHAFEERDGARSITLAATRASETYVPLVELGDSNFPTAYPATQNPLYVRDTRVRNPQLSTGTVVGIVVGFVLGAMLLAGVGYVYLLRLRSLKRMRRRRRRAKRGKSGSSGRGPAPSPPPPPPAEADVLPKNP